MHDNPPCSRRLQAKRPRTQFDTLSTALATGEGSTRWSGRSSRRQSPVPAEIAVPSEFEVERVSKTDYFPPFVVIEDVSEGESKIKTEGGSNKRKTDRRRAFSMLTFTERWRHATGSPMRNAYMMQEGGTKVSAKSSIFRC